jgi:glyoxylase-like metal-dependent hydrolase (beta-lactamase superfamily II)
MMAASSITSSATASASASASSGPRHAYARPHAGLCHLWWSRRQIAAFVGDTLFMPDYGTGTLRLPGGDARMLFRSIHAVLALPPQTHLYMCHDYQPNGRELRFVTTVAEEREANIHVHTGISEDAFVAMRTHGMPPGHADPAAAVGAGQHARRGIAAAEANGVRYLKIPINAL